MAKRKHQQQKNKGAAASTTTPKTIKPNFNDNSAFNQRLKSLDYLLEHGSITSSEAREKLDIYYPPARIFELRQAGYLIVTIWDNWTSEHGIKHRIGRYVLTQKEPVESVNASEVA
jgi:Helix-turn-helix domain